MFAPSSYSYGDHASNLRHRLAQLERRRDHTRRGTKAYAALRRAIHDLHAQIAKATHHGPMYRHRSSSAPPSASTSADVATADGTSAAADDHDLEVSADVSVDTDVPLFKRPIFWLGLGVVGVAYWKRDSILAIVKGA
jgi:hypothetical protein